MIQVTASEVFPITATLLDEHNNLISGKQVYYDIRTINDLSLQPSVSGIFTESSIASGVYTSTISIAHQGNYVCYITCSGFPTQVSNIKVEEATFSEQVWSHSKAIELVNNVKFIKAIESGAWKIYDNKMYFFQEDNTTETAIFELFDRQELLSESNVLERRRLIAFCYNCILDENGEKILDEIGDYLLDET